MADEYSDVELQFLNEGIMEGNTSLLRQLLATHPELSVKFKREPECFVEAFMKPESALGTVSALIEYGFDPNVSDGLMTPLTNAISESRLDIARLLLEKGADPNIDRPLISALNCDDPELVLPFLQLLLDHGADVNRVFELFGDKNTMFTATDWATKPEHKAFLRANGEVVPGVERFVTGSGFVFTAKRLNNTAQGRGSAPWVLAIEGGRTLKAFQNEAAPTAWYVDFTSESSSATASR